MKPIILAFSGPMRSGKSSVSKQVAQTLHWPRASFGEYIRMQARREGLNESREVLQHLGNTIIETEGWEVFCRNVLEEAHWRPGTSLVVDGIRHREVLEAIQKLAAPVEIRLVFVAINQQVQTQRMLGKDVATVEELQRVEADSTEEQVKTVLPEMADITVDGTQPPDEIVQKIIGLVEHGASTIDDNSTNDTLLEAAYQRGIDNKKQLFQAEGGILEANAVGRLLHIDEKIVDAQRILGKLVGVSMDNQHYVYPKWQFQEGKVLPGLEQVLAVLRRHDVWMQTAFMLNENTYLQGETPLALLRLGHIAEVLRAAHSYGEHGAS